MLVTDEDRLTYGKQALQDNVASQGAVRSLSTRMGMLLTRILVASWDGCQGLDVGYSLDFTPDEYEVVVEYLKGLDLHVEFENDGRRTHLHISW